MTFVRLERPVHYGNAGLAFNESSPKDDPYIFKPENTRDVWSSCRDITERYGFDFHADENGDFVLTTRNNPHVVFDLEASDIAGAPGVHPSSYAGTYLICNGTSGTISITAARIDIVCPRAPGLGTLNFQIRRVSDNVIVTAGTVFPLDATAPAAGLHYYDYRNTVDGSNTTVATLYSGWFDDYDVELTCNGTIWLDSLHLWHTDPMQPILPNALKTEQNAMSVVPRPTAAEVRNYVIVVGRRLGTVTDSEKIKANPENPESEFVVAGAVDSASIVDPSAPNFFGWLKESIIYDAGITDKDFAEYLARTFIYRYRDPRPNAPISHTFLPCIKLRDPIYAEENTYGTIDSRSVLWVNNITHRFENGKVTTELDTTSYPEYASYEVRQDIDIDKTFYGQPVINIQMNYKGLDGTSKTNLDDTVLNVPGARQSNTLAPNGDIVQLANMSCASGFVDLTGQPWPPQAGTVLIKPSGQANVTQTLNIPQRVCQVGEMLGSETLAGAIAEPTSVTIQSHVTFGGKVNPPPGGFNDSWPISKDRLTSRQFWYEWNSQTKVIAIYRSGVGGTGGVSDTYSATVVYQNAGSTVGAGSGWVGNTPYHRFTEIDWANHRILVPWEQGDGSVGYARDFATCELMYRALRGNQTVFTDPYVGGTPFYDPYTSELGNFVTLTFDALLSAVYRISVRSCYDDEVIAWLTEPTGDPADEEAHWQYFTAGAGKRLTYDAFDQVGAWNNRQAEAYAQAAANAFEQDQKPLPGGGWYAWNREAPQGNSTPLALISAQMSASKPVFGVGTYAEWYIRFEAKNDWLEDASDGATLLERLPGEPTSDDQKLGKSYPRILDTSNPRSPFKPRATNGARYQARLYTHLPEPTKVAIEVADWVVGAYDETNTAFRDSANWGPPDPDAKINNEKPIRIRFVPQARPGVLWANKLDELSVKLFRQVHLRANIMDQFVVFEGTNYPGQDVEARRVVNRMLTNDDHTLTFNDDHFRKGDSFRQVDADEGFEWIFRPDDFRKDWRGVPNEPLKFGEYLQLEELPKWDTERAIAGARSRFQIAFMNYLFYMSAYTQDRSGRFAWCINKSFADRAKITHNQTTITWPDDMQLQFRRSVSCRQWTDEKVRGDSGTDRLYQDHMAVKWPGTATARLSRMVWKSLDPVFLTGGGEYTDDYLNYHVNVRDQLPTAYSAAVPRQLGKGGSTSLGAWTWETSPSFPPNPTRDFHGYYLVPPMPDKQPENVITVYPDNRDYRNRFVLIQVDPRAFTDDGDNPNTGDDVAAQPTQPLWNSPIHDDTEPASLTADGEKRFWPGYTVTPGKETPVINKEIDANTIDYQRQDNLVHFEELRGIYSRTQRPQEAPKKIASINPYYQNYLRYLGVSVGRAREQQGLYPLYKAEVAGWFDFTFRREYVWESARFFPVNQYGQEQLDAVNKERCQMDSALNVQGGFGNVRYDSGAWTGWKDDAPVGSNIVIGPDSDALADSSKGSLPGARKFKGTPNVFRSDFMPWGVGPRMLDQLGNANTTDAIFHLVLVNERRTNLVNPAGT